MDPGGKVTEPDAPKQEPPRPGLSLPRKAGLGLAALVVFGAFSFIFGRATQDGAAAAGEPSLHSYAGEIEQLRQLIAQGRPDLVVGMADLYLANQERKPSPEAAQALADLRYQAAYRLVFALTGRRDHQAGQAALERWQEAEWKAEVRGLPREQRIAPLTAYEDAVDRSLWELARQAFLKAWEQHLVGPEDWRAISSYYSTLRNLGGVLIRSGDQELRKLGLAILRTAREISESYRLGRGEAHQDLVELLGPSTSAWPEPLWDDPVLGTGLAAQGR